MKYTSSNKPMVCMMTNSTCYKQTTKFVPLGILWHCTGANNPELRRYVQPSENDKNYASLMKLIGKNQYGNDLNHKYQEMGMNAWIGKLADGSVTTLQTMPWTYKPWGCYQGSNGSCNSHWIQFEICEDGLTNKTYFNAVYKEAVELTAYLCKLYNIDPNGTVSYNGLKVPTILCHQDAAKLKLGSNHSDVYNWFNKHGKTMNDVRKDVAALLKAAGVTNTTKVTKYEVVCDINRYSTAADAKAQKNAKSAKVVAGTYYIYNKYPNGVDGMFNITTDKNGASAGCWINPAENVKQLYRVRKSKDDAKSQIGAYSVLENAKKACQEAGKGYHVFDVNFKIVYSYKAPTTTSTTTKPSTTTSTTTKPSGTTTNTNTTTKPETTVVAVYNLDYANKVEIVSNKQRSEFDCTRAICAILKNNTSFDIEIAKTFFKLAPLYGIDPMMAISQSILETGWFKFEGSAVTVAQHNYCGLGVVSNGVNGLSFFTIEDGVHAQLQHLYAYGCDKDLPKGCDEILDPRYNYVTRGIAKYWQQLAGRWAVPGYDNKKYKTPQEAMENNNTYGQKIINICQQLEDEFITAGDVEQYFPKEQPKPEVKDEVIEDEENIKSEPELESGVTLPENTMPDMSAALNVFKKIVGLISKLFKTQR